MTVTIEFYGIPRLRAGVASLEVEAQTVREAVSKAAEILPDWASHCLKEGQLKKEYLMNINGLEFCRDEEKQLEEGDSLLIFSADVGG